MGLIWKPAPLLRGWPQSSRPGGCHWRRSPLEGSAALPSRPRLAQRYLKLGKWFFDRDSWELRPEGPPQGSFWGVWLYSGLSSTPNSTVSFQGHSLHLSFEVPFIHIFYSYFSNKIYFPSKKIPHSPHLLLTITPCSQQLIPTPNIVFGSNSCFFFFLVLDKLKILAAFHLEIIYQPLSPGSQEASMLLPIPS